MALSDATKVTNTYSCNFIACFLACTSLTSLHVTSSLAPQSDHITYMLVSFHIPQQVLSSGLFQTASLPALFQATSAHLKYIFSPHHMQLYCLPLQFYACYPQSTHTSSLRISPCTTLSHPLGVAIKIKILRGRYWLSTITMI